MQSLRVQKTCSALDKTVSNHNSLTNPLPSEMLSELRSFTQKFNAPLFQAAINCLQLATRYSDVWKETVMTVILERLPNVQAHSRPWARYTVGFAAPLPVEYVLQKWTYGDRTLVQRMREVEQHHQEAGNLGTITVMLCAECNSTSQPQMLHNVTFFGFGKHSFEAVDIGDDWREKLTDNIEKMCGRKAGEPGSS